MGRDAYTTPPRPDEVNYSESAVPAYTLPEVLTLADGSRVDNSEMWESRRRPELLATFAREVYGVTPSVPVASKVREVSVEPDALGGAATRLELDVTLLSPLPNARRSALTLRLLVWLPNRVTEEVPAFLGLNLLGNQSTHPDPTIRLAKGWVPNNTECGIVDNVASEASRGAQARRWPVDMIVNRGCALATLYAGDIDPDYDDGFSNGAHGFLASAEQTRNGADFASIGAWAWGLSRALEALGGVQRIDATKIGVVGHSRFGKAALWAGAQDPRFAWVISNNSGHGGAALSRRRFGELTRHLNERFPHWFATNFRRYDDLEQTLPVDQHQLLALIAPRPLYVASAELDLWADPRGEYLACLEASSAYRLFGLEGVGREPSPPELGRSLGDSIGYHCRAGGHDISSVDWWHYLGFVERNLSRR